jgi:uncharacterized protein (TIGR00730 family)
VKLERVCVYAGSSTGTDAGYSLAAAELARALVARGHGIVYGGGRVGLMGVVADTAIELGGEVIGVIPEKLVAQEVAHRNLTELRVVGSMHERKALMSQLSDAFVALPGGIGTVDELVEAMTWTQLGLHRKPCALLNVGGYYDKLVAFLDHAVTEQFLTPEDRRLLLVVDQPEALINALGEFTLPRAARRFDRESA